MRPTLLCAALCAVALMAFVAADDTTVEDDLFGPINISAGEDNYEVRWSKMPVMSGATIVEKQSAANTFKALEIVGNAKGRVYKHSTKSLCTGGAETYSITLRLAQDKKYSVPFEISGSCAASSSGAAKGALGPAAPPAKGSASGSGSDSGSGSGGGSFSPTYVCPTDVLSKMKAAHAAGTPALDVNEMINEGYMAFALCLQEIAQEGAGFSGSTSERPVWHAFAPWASLEVGKGEYACDEAASLLKGSGTSPAAYAAAVCAKIPKSWGPTASSAICAVLTGTGYLSDDLQVLGSLFVHFGTIAYRGSSAGDMSALFSGATIKAVAERMYAHVKGHSKGGIFPTAISIMESLRDGLREGNIAIYSDIGYSSQRFWEFYRDWRNEKGTRPTAADLIAAASTVWPSWSPILWPSVVDAAVASADVQAVYDAVNAKKGSPTADFYSTSPFDGFNAAKGGTTARVSQTYVAAGFALFLDAGALPASDTAGRTWRLEWANVLIAYREQAVSVAPTFVNPDYKFIFGAMTPFIQLGPKGAYWSLFSWLQAQPPCKKGILSDTRVTVADYDWSDFDDSSPGCPGVHGRWRAILASFNQAYPVSYNLWAHLNKDPRKVLAENDFASTKDNDESQINGDSSQTANV